MHASPENDLPPQIQHLVKEVVRRTRLWPREKKDVRAELQSHFREGAEELSRAGVTGEPASAALVERFGDPRLAARLIRRGK